MKKHNASKVVLITILVFLLLTWILPAAYYSSEYVDQGRVQMGFFDLFNYPLTSLSYFGYIAFFLILVGGFYGVLYKIPAYRSFLDKIVGTFKGHEKWVLSVIAVVVAVLVSICGVQVGIALFIPFIVSLVLLMGYDKIVAAFVTVGSIAAGLIGCTYASGNTSILFGALSLDKENNYPIIVRFAILVGCLALLIVYMLLYIKHHSAGVKIEKKTVRKVEDEDFKEKVVEEKIEVAKKSSSTSKKSSNNSSKKSKSTGKKNTKKSSSKSRRSDNKAALKEEDIIVVKESMMEEDLVPKAVARNHRVWPFVVTFSLLFVLFVLAFIPWSSFGVTLFDDVTKAVQDFTLFKFPIFAKVLGNVNSFGNWTITDLFFPMAFAATLLGLLYNLSFKDAYEGFVEGAKKALAPAVIVILLYTVLVLVTYHPFQLVIYKFILGLFKGFNVATTAIVAFLAGVFNVDISYSFQSIVPYYASVVTNVENFKVSAVIFQTMYGLTLLVAPTSLTLMATLAYLDIPYKTWLKNTWKFILGVFVVLLILFIILALI